MPQDLNTNLLTIASIVSDLTLVLGERWEEGSSGGFVWFDKEYNACLLYDYVEEMIVIFENPNVKSSLTTIQYLAVCGIGVQNSITIEHRQE